MTANLAENIIIVTISFNPQAEHVMKTRGLLASFYGGYGNKRTCEKDKFQLFLCFLQFFLFN